MPRWSVVTAWVCWPQVVLAYDRCGRLQGVAGADHRSAQASGASQSFSAVQDLIKRAQTGGEAGIVADMFASKDLDVLFAKPEIVGILLQEMPFLKSFNGVKPFYDKGANLTPDDVSQPPPTT